MWEELWTRQWEWSFKIKSMGVIVSVTVIFLPMILLKYGPPQSRTSIIYTHACRAINIVEISTDMDKSFVSPRTPQLEAISQLILLLKRLTTVVFIHTACSYSCKYHTIFKPSLLLVPRNWELLLNFYPWLYSSCRM